MRRSTVRHLNWLSACLTTGLAFQVLIIDRPPVQAHDPVVTASPPATRPQKRRKPKLDPDPLAELRAERARSRRAAIALEDQYGPDAHLFAAYQAGWNSSENGGSGPGTSAATASGGAGSSGSAGSGGSGGTGNLGTATGITGGSTGNLPPGTTSNTIPDLNAKVLEFAEKNLGKQVGNGQCWALGARALDYAGAQPPQGYVFGEEVPLSQALPGDILQFYNARFVGQGYWMILGAPHHTAIIESISGQTITMLNQNVNNVLKVQISIIHANDLVSGQITVYRPVARNFP